MPSVNLALGEVIGELEKIGIQFHQNAMPLTPLEGEHLPVSITLMRVKGTVDLIEKIKANFPYDAPAERLEELVEVLWKITGANDARIDEFKSLLEARIESRSQFLFGSHPVEFDFLPASDCCIEVRSSTF